MCAKFLTLPTVLSLIVKGLTNKEIWAVIGKTEDQVKKIVLNMREKLGLADRGQLGVYAVLNGFIKEEELTIFRKQKNE